MDKNLRLLAASIITESKLSKVSKLQLLSFVKEEASDAQVKALLMDAEIVELDEAAEEIVNERFKGHRFGKYLNEMDPVTVWLGLTAAAAAAVAGKIAIEVGKNVLIKSHKACKKYKGNEKQICIEKFKKQAISAQINSLASQKNKCSKTKDPKKCAMLIDKKINSLKAKQQKLIMT